MSWCGGRGVVGVVVCRGDVVVVWLHGRHVWLLLVSQLGTKKGVLTVITSPKTTNDDIVVVHRLVATSPTATWHLVLLRVWSGREWGVSTHLGRQTMTDVVVRCLPRR